MLNSRHFSVALKDFFFLYLYVFLLVLMTLHLPGTLTLYADSRSGLIALGVLGIWRYTWWGVHVIRSLIYTYLVFPARRRKADALWERGFRPNCLYFMMTTFNEREQTTHLVLSSIWRECEEINVPVKLFVGIGAESDEMVIKQFITQNKANFPLTVSLVRQTMPGKRFAIGETMRAIVASGLKENDPVIFMDGDTFFKPGCLKACLPFFELYPRLQALTSYEEAIVYNGPHWIKKWLEMRFIQRDFTMRSYALSNKVLTLTGRMSIFRGKYLLFPEFIEIIENDHLTDWLWGRYRFLSGDDKSTWYFLLKQGAHLFYIPDATTVTIEYISGSPLNRMKENLRRWSGNMLRNGARAIALGPKRVGFFIWWCLVDQRISIWNMPIGLMIMLVLAFTTTPAILLLYFAWIAFSRLCLSTVLFYYAKRIDMSYPFILYANQWMNSLIKIYILFRLPQQRWTNRGNQCAGFDEKNRLIPSASIANMLLLFYCGIFFFSVLLYLEVIALPTLADLKVLL